MGKNILSGDALNISRANGERAPGGAIFHFACVCVQFFNWRANTFSSVVLITLFLRLLAPNMHAKSIWFWAGLLFDLLVLTGSLRVPRGMKSILFCLLVQLDVILESNSAAASGSFIICKARAALSPEIKSFFCRAACADFPTTW